MQFQLRGVPALVAVVLFALFALWRTTSARADLETGAAGELTQWLRAEYARERLAGITDAGTLASGAIDSLIATQNVTFTSIEARGAPDDMIVRIVIQVDGRPPADGREVRYYRMSHSTINGWRLRGETTALAYWLKLF